MQDKELTNLPVPSVLLNHHLIALGKTRAGKSSKLRVLVEALLTLGKPTCIIDPKGDWHGLKSSSDGKSAGFSVTILGGEHADVPINAYSGSAVAELIATESSSTLIDLGGWTVGDRTRFFIDFASTLFKTSKGMRHLVIDEVHNFAPQGKIMDPAAGMMLHWANRLASEGAGKGITIFAASQRPQKVHKDFLTSCETLIACKVIHKLDREAIKDWIDGCADVSLGKQVISELAQLQKPQAWVWCPEIEFGPKCITFPMFTTFDSFKPWHSDTFQLKRWAPVNLDEVRAKFALVVQEAEANDPAALKKRIVQLERDAKSVAPTVDKQALVDEYKRGYAEGELAGQTAWCRENSEHVRHILHRHIAEIAALCVNKNQEISKFFDGTMNIVNERIAELIAPKFGKTNPNIVVNEKPISRHSFVASPSFKKAQAEKNHARTYDLHAIADKRLGIAGDVINKALKGFLHPDLTSPERRVLDACAWVNVMTRKEILNTVFVAMIADYAVNASSFKNPRSSLHKKGLIEYVDGDLKLTDAGAQQATWPDNFDSHDQLHQRILGRLADPERRLLEPLLRVYPSAMDAADLAKESNYALEASSFKNPRAKLHVLGLIEYLPGKKLRAGAELFP